MSEFTSVKDSGARQSFVTGSVRDLGTGKGRYDLIPAYPMKRLAVHYENGASKYGDRNWEKGQNVMRYIESAIRHAFNLLDGDQSEDHPAALIWNVFSYLHTLNEIEAGRLPKELDDRPERMKSSRPAKITPPAPPSPRDADLKAGKLCAMGCPGCDCLERA
jgi:hypothetical protein